MSTPPTIIIGMHRSGTSLLARLLEQNGCYMGYQQLAGLTESSLMYDINKKLLEMADSSWSCPENWLNLQSKLQDVLGLYIPEFLTDYWEQYVSKHNPQRSVLPSHTECSIPWGWKDPVNSLTYRQWYKIFPKAKFIHIYRHPVDVVNSLFIRESKETQKFINFIQKNGIKPVYDKEIFKCITSRCLHLDSAISLWIAYVQSCLAIDNIVPAEQIFHVKYEDLLDNPQDTLTKVIHFVGCILDPENIQNSIAGINKERKYAFSQTPELVALYKTIQNDPLLQKLGYSNISYT